MLRKILIPTLKQQKNIQSLIKNQVKLNFSTYDPEELNIKMNLYLSENVARQFIIGQSTTFEELEELLKNEDPKISTIKFNFNNETLNNPEYNFVDFALNNHLDLYINNKNHAFDFDLSGNAAYYNNSKFDAHFARQEVPILDAELLNNYMNVYHKQLEQNHPNQQTYSVSDVQQAAIDALGQFSEKNNPINIQQKAEIYQNLLRQLESEKQKLQALENEAENKSYSFIKGIILLNVIQGAILFYLTYWVWGWDVVEPISYLIALSVESVGLYYFIKKGRGLSLREMFDTRYAKYRLELLQQKKSTNADKQMEFLRNKLAHLKSKIDYGTTI